MVGAVNVSLERVAVRQFIVWGLVAGLVAGNASVMALETGDGSVLAHPANKALPSVTTKANTAVVAIAPTAVNPPAKPAEASAVKTPMAKTVVPAVATTATTAVPMVVTPVIAAAEPTAVNPPAKPAETSAVKAPMAKAVVPAAATSTATTAVPVVVTPVVAAAKPTAVNPPAKPAETSAVKTSAAPSVVANNKATNTGITPTAATTGTTTTITATKAAANTAATAVPTRTNSPLVLETPSFVVTLTPLCGNQQSCEEVQYQGVNKQTSAQIVLQGAVLRETCKPQAQPCPIRLYQFTNGSVRYQVLPAGVLQVLVKQHEIIREQGQWRAEQGVLQH